MRKRRIWLIAVLVAIFALTAVLGLTACKKGGEETPTDVEENPTDDVVEEEVVLYDGETALSTALTTALSNAYTFSAEVERASEYGRDFEVYTVSGAGDENMVSATNVSEYYAEYMGVREKFSGSSGNEVLITVDGERTIMCYYDIEERYVSMYSWYYAEAYSPLDYLLGEDPVQTALKIVMNDHSLMTLTDGVYIYTGTLTEEDIGDFWGMFRKGHPSFSNLILEVLTNLSITVSKNTIVVETSYTTDDEVKEKITFNSGVGEVDKSIYNEFYNTRNEYEVEIDGVDYWYYEADDYFDEGGWVADDGEDASGAVVIPSEIAGRPVIAIEYEAFADNKSITSVEIPSSVLYIWGEAFYGCTKLATVKLNKGLKEIDDSAFEGCEKLTSVTLPDGLEYIGDAAFCECYRLGSVNIPDSVTEIGWGVFYETAGYYPDDPGFEKLVSFDANGIGYVGNWAVYYDYDRIEESSEVLTLREGTVGIASGVFCGAEYFYCSDYEGDGDIFDGDTIGYAKYQSLSYEEQDAFEYLEYYYICVTAVGGYKVNDVIFEELYENLSEAAKDCFQPCFFRYFDWYEITEVSVPESLKYIGIASFGDNYSLKTVSVFKDGEPTYTIPNLVKIGEYAFGNCEQLQKLIIPASCTTIDYDAFWNCDYLHLSFDDISKLQDFILEALVSSNDDYNIYPKITAPGLEIKDGLVYIGSVCYGIYGQFTDYSINIAAGTTEIAYEAFYSSYTETEVDEIKLPSGLTKIGEYAFESIEADIINLPASLTEIGKYAFYYDFKTVVIDSAMFAALDLRGLYEIGFSFKDGAKVYYKTGLTPSAELLPYLTKLTLSGKAGYTAYAYSNDSSPVDCGEIELEEAVEIELFRDTVSVYSFEATADTVYTLTLVFDNLIYYNYRFNLEGYYYVEADYGEFVLIDGVPAVFDEENDDHIGEQRFLKNYNYDTTWWTPDGAVDDTLTAPDFDGLIYLELSVSSSYGFELPKVTLSVFPEHTPLTLGDSVELLSRIESVRSIALNVTEDDVGKTYFFYSEGEGFLNGTIYDSSDLRVAFADSESYRLGNFIMSYTFEEAGTYDLDIYRYNCNIEQSVIKIYSVEKSEEILGGEDGVRAVAVGEASYIYVVTQNFKYDGKVYRIGNELTQAEFDLLGDPYNDGSYTDEYFDRAMATKITYTFAEAGYYKLSLTAGENCATLDNGVHFVTFESATGNKNRSFDYGTELIEGDALGDAYEVGDELYDFYASDEYAYFDAGTITFYITADPNAEIESFSVISVMEGLTKSDIFPD